MNKKKKKVLILSIAMALFVLAGIGLFFFKMHGKGTTGVLLLPTKVIELPEMTYYLQRGENWSEDPLGASRFTVGSSGCLVTSLASLMNTYGIEVTPGVLNQRFTEKEVYNSSGDVIWGSIADAYPELSVEVKPRVDAAEIEKSVEEGTYPLAKVKYLGDGYWHWVLLIGSDVDGYLCMDPLYEEKKARPLSDHGNMVYAWRVVSMKRQQ